MAEPQSNLTMTGIPDLEGNFTSNYASGDGNPNPVVLTPANVIDATPGQPYTATFTISGTTVPVAISVTGATMRYKIGGGAFTTTPGTIDPGASGEVELTAPMVGGEVAGGTLVIGGQVTIFSVTSVESETPDPGDWQLAEAYRVGQKLPMRVIYPRPDLETSEFAHHRKANSNWAHQVRICIQGGEPPFKLEIVDGPVGATIVGEMTRTVDPATGLIVHSYPVGYSTVTWPNPSGSTEWDILVTDQNLDTVHVTWSTEQDDSAHIVLDAVVGNDANAGTFESPIKTFPAGLWKSDYLDTTYVNKIAAYKTGTYEIHQGVAGENISLNAETKPISHICIEPNVIWDTSPGHVFVNSADVALIGMSMIGSKTTEENNRIIQVSTTDANTHFCGITFGNQTSGTESGDNPSCIVLMDNDNSGVFHENVSIVDCVGLDSIAMQLVCTFACDGVVIENNTALDFDVTALNGSNIIHAKDDTKNISIRYNTLRGNSIGPMIAVSNQQTGSSNQAYNQEVCYNIVETENEDWEGGPIQWNQAAVAPRTNAANTHSYRNTIISPTYAIGARSWNGGDPVEVGGDAYVAPAGYVYSIGSTPSGTPSIALTGADLTSNAQLTDATGKRTLHLGKIGFEHAST